MPYRILDLDIGRLKILDYPTRSKAQRVSRRMNKREQRHRYQVETCPGPDKSVQSLKI